MVFHRSNLAEPVTYTIPVAPYDAAQSSDLVREFSAHPGFSVAEQTYRAPVGGVHLEHVPVCFIDLSSMTARVCFRNVAAMNRTLPLGIRRATAR